MKAAGLNSRRLERVVAQFNNIAPRLVELAGTGALTSDVVEALVLDFESRWASMDVILSAYEGLPFYREVDSVAAFNRPPLRVEIRRKDRDGRFIDVGDVVEDVGSENGLTGLVVDVREACVVVHFEGHVVSDDMDPKMLRVLHKGGDVSRKAVR